MSDLLWQAALSNVSLALLLALAALLVSKKTRNVHLAHFLWLLVLVKLVTPPILSFPVDWFGTANELPSTVALPSASEWVEGSINSSSVPVVSSAEITEGTSWISLVRPLLLIIWLAGTCLLAAVSLYRVFRFHNLLLDSCRPADKDVQQQAARICRQLGLKKAPTIHVTSARLCPMVWWAGRGVRVVLPAKILEAMQPDQWRWVLAHELAHVRRRDHLVRWLEWLATCVFWWNPVVWFTRSNLRAAEEVCCDELVMTRLKPQTRSYAESILCAVESLALPVIRPPAMASEINSGGFLERRIEMIMSESRLPVASRVPQVLVVCFAVLFIPLGIVNAQDFEAVKKRLMKAVKKNEITLQQAATMMETLEDSVAEDRYSEVKPKTDKWREIHDLEEAKRMAMVKQAVEKLQRAREAGEITSKDQQVMRDLEFMRLREKQESESDFVDNTPVEYAEPSYETAKQEYEFDLQLFKKGAITAEELERKKLQKLQAQIQVERAKVERDLNAERKRKTADDFKVDPRENELHAAMREVEKKLKAGEITREQAFKVLGELRERLGGDDLKQSALERERLAYEAVLAELEAAVAAGKLTRQEAKKKLAELEKARKFKRSKKKPENSRSDDKDKERMVHKEIVQKIKQAVEAGDITEEEAKKKLAALSKSDKWKTTRTKKGKSRSDLAMQKKTAEFLAKIEHLLEAGEITPKQAEKMIQDFQKKMKGSIDD